MKESKKHTGDYDKYEDFNGNIFKVAKLISFAKMDNLEFELLLQHAIDVILKYVIIGEKNKFLRKKINIMIDE